MADQTPSTPNADSGSKDQETVRLEHLKLKAEIASLERSPWVSPALLVPLFATLTTLAYSQWVGFFDLKKAENKLENDKAAFATQQLEVEKQKLKVSIEALAADKTKLETERQTTTKELAALTLQRDAAVGRAKEADLANEMATQAYTASRRLLTVSQFDIFFAKARQCDESHGMGSTQLSINDNDRFHSALQAYLEIIDYFDPDGKRHLPTDWQKQDISLNLGTALSECLSRESQFLTSASQRTDQSSRSAATQAQLLSSFWVASYDQLREGILLIGEAAVRRPQTFDPPTPDDVKRLGPYKGWIANSQEQWAKHVAGERIQSLVNKQRMALQTKASQLRSALQ